jgi:Flp pilus assembly protein CpaB
MAGIGIYSAYQGADDVPTTQFVVARSDIAPGTVVTNEHVGLVAMSLPDLQSSQAFNGTEDGLVLGSVAIQAVGGGELLQRSDLRVGPASDAAASTEISFEIDTARALNGKLQAGEHVDLIATFGSGLTATTEQVLSGVRVVAVDRESNSSLATDQIVITLALDRSADAVAVARAIDTGKLTLVRAAG